MDERKQKRNTISSIEVELANLIEFIRFSPLALIYRAYYAHVYPCHHEIYTEPMFSRHLLCDLVDRKRGGSEKSVSFYENAT
jgi:hypothetical protein